MSTNQNLSELPEQYAKYDKRIKFCIEFLFEGLSPEEKEQILTKARHDFLFYLGLYHYQTYVVTAKDALDYAICTMTRDREQSRRAICACSLFRIVLKNCLYSCRIKIGVTKKIA